MSNTVPIIRLELEGMKSSLAAMLSEHTAMIDENVQRAVDEYFADGRLERVVAEQVQYTLNNVIEEEITSFFKYGDGRTAIRESVSSCMDLVSDRIKNYKDYLNNGENLTI